MSEGTVLPLPLWRHPRRTGALLLVLGLLVILLGLSLMEGSHELEHLLTDQTRSPAPAPAAAPSPAASASSPTNTSS